MPSLEKYFTMANMNRKDALNAYLRSLGKDPSRIWSQIDESIRSAYMAKLDLINSIGSKFSRSSVSQFFEMVRFDFVLDEQMNVYLMEANMSPNLSSAHFAQNGPLFDHVIYNVLSLVGMVNRFHVQNWPHLSNGLWNMMVSDKDLSVFEDTCTSADCLMNCDHGRCDVCLKCLGNATKLVLKEAYLEHQNKFNNRRLIPTTSQLTVNSPSDQLNQLQSTWFKGMCDKDVDWCD